MSEDVSESQAEFVCSNPECRNAEGGRCIDGFALDECPHFGHEVDEDVEEDVEEAGSTAKQATPAEPLIELPGAGSLFPGEAVKYLGAGDSRLIAIMGPRESGKTSLIGGLFDLYQRTVVADCPFSRSVSLHAFEQVCHDARLASKREKPTTERTRQGNVRFYHLEVHHQAKPVVMLLADRAGEDYTNASNKVELAQSFDEIKRADSISVLVDGEKLASNEDRANAKFGIKLMLQAVIDAGIVTRKPLLILVLTKLDSVLKSAHKDRVATDFQAIVDSCIRDFEGHFSRVESVRIAASPKQQGVNRGSGIDELFRLWLEKPVRARAPLEAAVLVPKRAFSRLTAKAS